MQARVDVLFVPRTSRSGMSVFTDANVETKTTLVSPITTAHIMDGVRLLDLYIF